MSTLSLWCLLALAAPTALSEAALKACVVRLADDTSFGSGTCIGYDDAGHTVLILSCHHVCGVSRRLTAYWPDGVKAVAELLAAEPAQDLVLLTANLAAKPALARIARRSARLGDLVWKVGYAGGRLNVTVGPCVDTGDHLHWRSLCRPGDSGGGLFDRAGDVVGVATAYLTRQPEIGAGTGLEPIRALLRRAGWPDGRRAGDGKRGSESKDPGVGQNQSVPRPGFCPLPSVPRLPDPALAGRLERLQAEVADLRKAMARPGARGDKGEPGPLGLPGPQGPPGKDADPAALAALREEVGELRQRLDRLSTTLRVRVEPVRK